MSGMPSKFSPRDCRVQPFRLAPRLAAERQTRGVVVGTRRKHNLIDVVADRSGPFLAIVRPHIFENQNHGNWNRNRVGPVQRLVGLLYPATHAVPADPTASSSCSRAAD